MALAMFSGPGNVWRSPGLEKNHFSVRVRGSSGPAWETPSISHGTLIPSMSATVGTRSTCSQLRSLACPSVWPGALMNSGTHRTWSTLPGVAWRRPNSLGLKLMPWSAVTTNRVSSYIPCSWSRRMTWPMRRSVSPVCIR
jgi:hypothetical protein